jgi:hypothetical protein
MKRGYLSEKELRNLKQEIELFRARIDERLVEMLIKLSEIEKELMKCRKK